ncbi:uncharacterized protein Z519_06240 [Cladophialophora bantiana CBS 173.52]|uniref:BHLH domain-containing protein n=1 Tax=Cladophialophora bantiana (strain ATCC 10958 / CBS 173.52 / CDC B-1940 / NIH 8579) TaxID=1442370 RepID=A0A0D2HS05_CLAB1|nr:uncharacterized protein Z519_06240 [Cladophialophora bantiana CBS 173.52]KIW93635.1 hypothetical protein Z519_06240 [Cladophialophora bantiana CBS 173.52]
MSAHSLVDFGISNVVGINYTPSNPDVIPLNDIDVSIFQPFIRHEYLKDQPGPLLRQEQHLQLHNATFPIEPLGTGAGPPSQFPLSPPISFDDYETLQSTTPEDCYHANSINFEQQASTGDGLPQDCQEPDSPTLNTVAVSAVNWSEVVPWVSTKPPSRGRPRGSRRKLAARNADSVDETASKPRAKRGRKPRVSRQQTSKSLADESNKASLEEAKAAHSVVERRYRDNLNGKMSQLYYVLREVNSPSPRSRLSSTGSGGSGGSSGGGDMIAVPTFQPPTRVRKSEILNSAIDYIHQSEVEMRHMADEIKHLQDKERTIKNLVKCEEWSVLKALLRAPGAVSC